METAQKQAKEIQELILLNFSGSDWCIPCIKLHKIIIESDSFQQLITDHIIVYVNADFPRNKKNQPTEAVKRENSVLAEQYNSDGIFPSTLLLDESGNILKRWDGFPKEDALAFSNQIKTIFQNLHQK